MRDSFVHTLIELAKADPSIELLTGDLGFGVLKPYWESVPDQFLNVGIAEQNMASVAAGMALTGKTVFTYSIGNFPTLRCLEQIRNDCAYHHANVKIVCVGGGFVYGSLGMSHHATEDLAIMRALPDVVVMAPGDPEEAITATRLIARYPGTCYLRLGRGGEARVHEPLDDYQLGQALCIRRSNPEAKVRIALLSTGGILDEACAAAETLAAQGLGLEQYSFPTVKPLDANLIRQLSQRCNLIVTVEEHNILGGFGSAVAEVMAECASSSRLLRIGIQDLYSVCVGSQKYLREQYGLDAASIVSRTLQYLHSN